MPKKNKVGAVRRAYKFDSFQRVGLLNVKYFHKHRQVFSDQ
jgi:hypothetical protein